MRCTKCDTDNREGRKFCASCGSPLTIECPKCSAANVAGEQFCGDCGASLTVGDNSSLRPQSAAADRAIIGERRHLTILFCDLVGSVTLTSQLDPEEWRATVAGYQRAASEAVTRFGGEVVKYLGDGIMAFFGYPIAHDNDAERAARAGLAILDAIAQLNQQAAGTKLAVRIGIDSGSVVVGTGAGQAVDAFGDAANIAARVQSATEPDTVVVTGATHRLISGLFVVEDRGAHQLKGIERPVQLYRVVRPSGLRSRFEAAAATTGLTPFIGREDELRSLLTRWERAREGEGQVALILGEAGIGKSRLVRRFHETIAGTPHTWLEAGAGAFFQNTPFYPVTETLHQMLGEAPAQDQLSQLASSLRGAGLKPTEAIPLLTPLLNLSLPPEYPPSSLSPEQQRRRLLATLVDWLLGAARTQPLINVIEDLHWADPSTLEVVQLLVEQAATAPLMLIYTARPEFRVPWPLRAHHAQLTLNRLSARDVRTMVAQVAAAKALPHETVAAVVERTGGVPLFVEELTRAVLERGDVKSEERDIPATLHDSLMARLDRLGAAKEVAQISAVLGREFSYELLRAVHPVVEADLQQALRKLTEAELLYVRGIAPDATYQFKHALIRDAAYEALLKSRRRELHLQVARTIDQQFPSLVETRPEVLARHWTEAGEKSSAIAAWQRAGNQAVDALAYREAEQHFHSALDLLSTAPDLTDRDACELDLQLALGGVLVMTRGNASVEPEQAYLRACQLAKESDAKSQFPALLGLRSIYLVRGEIARAHDLGLQLLNQARAEDDDGHLLEAHLAQGNTLVLQGEFQESKIEFEKTLKLYNRRGHRSHASIYGFDPAVFSLCRISWIYAFNGYLDQASTKINECLALAAEVAHPASSVLTSMHASDICRLRGELDAARKFADTAMTESQRHGLVALSAQASMYAGNAMVHQGLTAKGIKQVREGLARLRQTGAYLFLPFNLTHLAEACLSERLYIEGLAYLDEALDLMSKSKELMLEAELWRIKGELSLQAREAARAENLASAADCFHKAIVVARNQRAKLWELRAVTSLARLQGAETFDMLSEVYNWFTEGLDTYHLQVAKKLLESFNH